MQQKLAETRNTFSMIYTTHICNFNKYTGMKIWQCRHSSYNVDRGNVTTVANKSKKTNKKTNNTNKQIIPPWRSNNFGEVS